MSKARTPKAQTRSAGDAEEERGGVGEVDRRRPGDGIVWSIHPMGHLCLSTALRDPREFPDRGFKYIDISSIDRGTKCIVNVQSMLGAEAPSRARKEVEAGDVLVSTVRPNLNAVALVRPHLHGAIASTGFCVLRADPRVVEPRFLFFFCRTQPFVDALSERVRGAHYPAVTDADVKDSQLSVPPLSEQRAIVEILDQADRLRRLCAEADAKADRILPVLFIKMFGDPAINPKGWPRRKLGELLERIDSGWSPVCENRQAAPDEWAVLKLGAVTTNRYLETENKALPSAVAPQPELEVRPGDLLFSRKNTRELVGACAYVQRTRPKLLLSDLVFRLRLKANAGMQPLYLWALLTNPSKRSSIEVLAGGSAGSMPNISKGRLETLEIEKPPHSLQTEFADNAASLASLREKATAAHEVIEKSFSVLLHRAFTGEVTAMWRVAHMKELLQEMEQQTKALAEAQ